MLFSNKRAARMSFFTNPLRRIFFIKYNKIFINSLDSAPYSRVYNINEVKTMQGLTISQVARKANVNIETVRYYEKTGLISKPPRMESGYRCFPPEVVKQITFVKRAQELGFTLSEIKELITIANGEHYNCGEIASFDHKNSGK